MSLQQIKLNNFVKLLYTVCIVAIIMTVYYTFISKELLEQRNDRYSLLNSGFIGNLVPWKDRIDMQRMLISPYDELPKTDPKFRYLRLTNLH
jgi:hypothetical protein